MEARDYLNEEARQNIAGSMLDEQLNASLLTKWTPLLEGVTDSWTRHCMARLYENEMQHLNDMKRKVLTESSLSGNVPDLVKFVFPVIRKVWANLVANGLFSVQPTSSPIGGIFYWDYKYGTSKGLVTAGDKMVENFDRWYSSEYVESEVIGAGPAANFTGTMAWKPIKPYGLGQIGIEYLGTAVSDSSTKRILDAAGTGTLSGDTGAASTLNLTTGVYDITFSENVTGVVANYFFDMEASSDNVPQVNIDIQRPSRFRAEN